MFESLSDKLNGVFANLTRKGKLSEEDVNEALRAVRLALLEADVDFKVVRQFTSTIRERAKEENIFGGLTPGQSVIRIVREELTEILGGEAVPIQRGDRPPSVIMLVGLQGSGKTTTAAKLALSLRKQTKQDVMLAACDLRRFAAIDQLVQLGKQINVPVFSERGGPNDAVRVARAAVEQAKREQVPWLIIDTGGRLHIDDELMRELDEMKQAVSPVEILLVVDALVGQDAVRSGSEFHQRLGLTGMVMTKMDGDARGGAALSMRSVTGVPIKYIAVGEKTDALEAYHPNRLASRILGMGDVESLIEKAEEQVDAEEAAAMQRKLRRAEFDLEDLLSQFRAIKKMGALGDILGMVPGMNALRGRINPADLDDKRVGRIEAIILSMTPQERSNPKIINGSRRKRISDGSGTTPAEVNQLLNQFWQVQKMMKQFSSKRGQRRLAGMLGARR